MKKKIKMGAPHGVWGILYFITIKHMKLLLSTWKREKNSINNLVYTSGQRDQSKLNTLEITLQDTLCIIKKQENAN